MESARRKSSIPYIFENVGPDLAKLELFRGIKRKIITFTPVDREKLASAMFLYVSETTRNEKIVDMVMKIVDAINFSELVNYSLNHFSNAISNDIDGKTPGITLKIMKILG